MRETENSYGLTDIYAFSDWLKKFYIGSGRKTLKITPEIGGLITVTVVNEDKSQ